LDVLFLHPNFPGQFKLLAQALADRPGMRVHALGDRSWMPQNELSGITIWAYDTPDAAADGVHAYLRGADAAVRRGQVVARFLMVQKQKGFEPDVIYTHPGWGDALYVKDIFPDAQVISLLEYFYQPRGADVGFDKEFPLGMDDIFRVRTLNFVQHMALEGSDIFISPTTWQKSRYPQSYQAGINVIHEGIDTEALQPDSNAQLDIAETTYTIGEQTFSIPSMTLRKGDEVLTFVSRSLEPYRGFHVFMRSLPAVLRHRPKCHVVIVGKLQAHYGPMPRQGGNWRDVLLSEIAPQLDQSMLERIHFLGQVTYARYLQVLQVSRVHAYLTYPFILSWSVLEAMALGSLVVASKTPPVEEVIEDGHNGLLVAFHSPEALAARMAEALTNPEQYDHLRAAARQTVRERFDFTNTVLPLHLQLLDQLQQQQDTLTPMELHEAIY
jgi:glycosyltransferase involved in cell wall biosynthesis